MKLTKLVQASLSQAGLKQAMLAGIAGTVVMTVFSFVSHYIQLPHADFVGIITHHLQTGTVFSWLIYFGFGIVLAYLYGAYFRDKLPAYSWMRGVVYSILLWGFMEMVLMPVFGMGFFSGSMPAAFGMLVGMGLYGATVGYLYEH